MTTPLTLIITRQSDQLLSISPRVSLYISDHAAVLCSIRSDKPPLTARNVSHRKQHQEERASREI